MRVSACVLLWVYPRTHGETMTYSNIDSPGRGLSPYTRGNLDHILTVDEKLGSIPVHTGKPDDRFKGDQRFEVYPRTHGETRALLDEASEDEGLSPYTRGNLTRRSRSRIVQGSIPVHTGKPGRHRQTVRDVQVYPRTHGETMGLSFFIIAATGLSPYTRGNPPDWPAGYFVIGSIPVHTGKPKERRCSR